ncbi:hypothetical protein [Nocardia sp. NPDC059228]|uniref:hypothetical protein n=1 Tax=Nocardia sp. NPDC059228 TaxID=3346777 RepID=UPI0036A06099
MRVRRARPGARFHRRTRPAAAIGDREIATGHLLAPTAPGREPDLDEGWFDRGIAARWRDKKVLDELDDLLDRVDAIAARYGID